MCVVGRVGCAHRLPAASRQASASGRWKLVIEAPGQPVAATRQRVSQKPLSHRERACAERSEGAWREGVKGR
ncbi:hypothetical protein [Candidatus Thiosymbion oneisti]|uniref:hypothetical protein n=1 Tax=Candidatus Thiosymbion oneisti TaxID=589554 RepID=UPI00141506E0|nr:hypothetical protein [Candidatus Thiosymbion oneisti]